MTLSFEFFGKRVAYTQPDLPWYKRIIGMKYGKGWYVTVHDAVDSGVGRTHDESPRPDLVMQDLMSILRLMEKLK